MRILVTAVSHSSHISGVQRHALNMVRCLLLDTTVTKVHLVLGTWQREMFETSGLAPDSRLTLHYLEIRRSSIARNLWYYKDLPKFVAQLQPDLVHLSYPMPINAADITCPTVLTLHDLYPYEIPRNFGLHQALFNRVILRSCLQSVDAIACVSDATMSRLNQFASSAIIRKATRIYNCVEQESDSSTRSPLPGWEGEPFLLTVAQHRRNKNIPLLLAAFNRLLRQGQIDPATRLVIVGIKGPETGTINSLVDRYGLNYSALFLEGLSQAELQWCYTHSAAVVLPSVTEGFGLPIAEGLLAGCRIVCSDIAAFREIGGVHCNFVALGAHAENSLAAAIRATLDQPDKAPVPLPHLSAHVLAREYASLYRGLIASASGKASRSQRPLSPMEVAERQSR